MVRSSLIALLCLCCLAPALACSSARRAAELQVRTSHAEGTDFSPWQTFRLASAPAETAGATDYPRYERMLRDALIEELTARGYERADDGRTDFRVAAELDFSGSRGSDGMDPTHGVDTAPTASGRSKPTATLIIRMLEPATSQVLWQGELAGLQIDAVTPETTLRKAVWRVLVEFPPIAR